jgi:hypothetical protein
MSNAKITILNNIIGINPTGTLEYQGTYTLNGNNDQIKNSEQISKENLEKTLNGEIVCNNVETFMNENNLYNTNIYKERYTNKITETEPSKQLQNYLNNIIIIFYIILILILISNSYLKKIFIYNIKNAKK